MHLITRVSIAILLVASLCAAQARAAVDAAAVDQAREKAVSYLAVSQNENGSWTNRESVGVTGVITTGLLDSGVTRENETVAQALAFLEENVQKDGGIYAEGSNHRNYETAIAIMAFSRANEDGKYDELIARATAFLKGLQWDEGEGIEKSHENYGGAGYGGHSRPDLSNTTFFVEALKNAGVPEDDPAMQKALIFISRCQNLESEHNRTEYATKVNDGGFYYTIAAGGSSKAGETPNGGLRSYGSMTYAGLKSMIYAGLDKDDPRTQAAFDWARQHYTLEKNPGMDQQGLYYYYQTFAKALDAMDVKTIKDAAGQTHDWRSELAQELLSRQNENGSWVNEAPRWLEGDPNLVTGYVLMALGQVSPPDEGNR